MILMKSILFKLLYNIFFTHSLELSNIINDLLKKYVIGK
jgi:hypothetical protein